MLVKTDAAASEYAVRISSTSVLQNLQGYAVLRYPVSAVPHLPPSGVASHESAAELCHACHSIRGSDSQSTASL